MFAIWLFNRYQSGLSSLCDTHLVDFQEHQLQQNVPWALLVFCTSVLSAVTMVFHLFSLVSEAGLDLTSRAKPLHLIKVCVWCVCVWIWACIIIRKWNLIWQVECHVTYATCVVTVSWPRRASPDYPASLPSFRAPSLGREAAGMAPLSLEGWRPSHILPNAVQHTHLQKTTHLHTAPSAH